MSKLRAPAVLRMSVAIAMVVSAALVYPLAKGYWTELHARRLQGRDFVIANDSDQGAIVRSLLISEKEKPPLCGPFGNCPKEPIYFDRLSATLRSVDFDGIWATYEVRTVRPQGSLVNRGDNSLPLRLQELLDQITQGQTYNADPMLPGIVYVATPQDLPVLGEPDSCGASINPRLLRVSRAAVQESEGLALVLIARTFCDRSGSTEVAKLQRRGAEWRRLEDY